MLDEYPGQAFLTPAQVQRLLAYRDRKGFVEFIAANPDFPKLRAIGKTKGGKPRMMYPKYRVYLWVEEQQNPSAK
jgi:hypothetical protein